MAYFDTANYGTDGCWVFRSRFEAKFAAAGEATSTLYSLFVSWRDYNLMVADGLSIIQTQANLLT